VNHIDILISILEAILDHKNHISFSHSCTSPQEKPKFVVHWRIEDLPTAGFEPAHDQR